MPYSWDQIKQYNTYLDNKRNEINILMQYACYATSDWATLKRVLEWIDSQPRERKFVLIVLYVDGYLENYNVICSGEKYEKLKEEGVTEWLSNEHFYEWIKKQNNGANNFYKLSDKLYWKNIGRAWLYGRLFCKALISDPIFKDQVIHNNLVSKSERIQIQQSCFSVLMSCSPKNTKDVLLGEVDPDRRRARWTVKRIIEEVLDIREEDIIDHNIIIKATDEQHDDNSPFITVNPRDERKTPDETSEERQNIYKIQELFTKLYKENSKQGLIFWLNNNIVEQRYSRGPKQPTQKELCNFFTTLGGTSNFSQHAQAAKKRLAELSKLEKNK